MNTVNISDFNLIVYPYYLVKLKTTQNRRPLPEMRFVEQVACSFRKNSYFSYIVKKKIISTFNKVF